MAIRHAVVAHLCAPQGCEVCAALEGLSDVAGQSADIGAFRADDAQGEAHGLAVPFDHLHFVNAQGLGAQCHVLAAASQIVGPFAFHLARREGGRHLHDFAHKAGQGLVNQGAGDMGSGIGGVDGMLQVVTRRGGSQLEGGHILLHARLQAVDAFGGAARANHHHACGQGVQRTCVAHLNLLAAHSLREQPAHFVDEGKGGDTVGLVEGEYLSSKKVHTIRK